MGYSLLSITDVLGFFFFLGLVNINLLNNIQMSSSQHKDKGRAEKEKKQDVMSCLPIYGSPFFLGCLKEKRLKLLCHSATQPMQFCVCWFPHFIVGG